MEVNRRPTGGGAILMGPDQLGVALAVPGRRREGAGWGGARRTMVRFSDGIVRALGELGVEAGFRGKNDLAVQGRKICGLGLSRDAGGGLLLHASLLVDLDVELMATLLRLPARPGEDAPSLVELAGRIATVRGCVGTSLALEDVRDVVARGFSRSFGVALERGELTGEELAEAGRAVTERYGREEWVFQGSQVADADGRSVRRTRGGTIDASVRLAGATIKALHLRGDFFESERAVAELEGRLRWHPTRAEALRSTVAEWSRAHGGGTLEAEALVDALVGAVADAGQGAEGARPYGCFVGSREAPEGTRRPEAEATADEVLRA